MKTVKYELRKIKSINVDQDGGQLIIEFRNEDDKEQPIIGKEQLIFFEKVLVQSEITYELLLLSRKDFSDLMPGYEGPVTVVDYITGQRVETNIHKVKPMEITRRVARLSSLWRHNDRHLRLKVGDIIGIAGSEIDHTLYIDFEYDVRKHKNNNGIQLSEDDHGGV